MYIDYIMEEEKVSISYDQTLQDIAGNLLEVKMVQQLYDPIGERLVAKMLQREAEDKATVFKSSVDIGSKSNQTIGSFAIPISTAAVPIPTEPQYIIPPKLARGISYDI
jgi:hypothetical protein